MAAKVACDDRLTMITCLFVFPTSDPVIVVMSLVTRSIIIDHSSFPLSQFFDVMSSGNVVASPVSGDASAAVILVTLR